MKVVAISSFSEPILRADIWSVRLASDTPSGDLFCMKLNTFMNIISTIVAF